MTSIASSSLSSPRALTRAAFVLVPILIAAVWSGCRFDSSTPRRDRGTTGAGGTGAEGGEPPGAGGPNGEGGEAGAPGGTTGGTGTGGSNGTPSSGGTAGTSGSGEVSPDLRPLTNAIAIAGNCALRDDGSVWCWGENTDGRLGLADRTVSVPYAIRVPGIDHATALSFGGRHLCAVMRDEKVRCWGSTFRSSLGNPDAASAGPISPPVEVVGLTGVLILSTGDAASCVGLRAGGVECWGSGSNATVFQTEYTEHSPEPATIPGVEKAMVIDVGTQHACIVNGDGEVWCWGGNNGGALGLESLGGRHPPLRFALPLPAIDVVAGSGFTCALLENGRVWCWGQGLAGRLGRAPTPNATISRLPGEVPTLDGVVSITGRWVDTCAVRDDGTVYCWGDGFSEAPDYVPKLVPTPPNTVAVGGFQVFCSLTANGGVYCSGSGGASLGAGSSTQPATDVPLPVMMGELQ